jgi:peptidylprolyl isomerase
MSRRILIAAGLLVVLVLTACQAAGKNPGKIEIPVIQATVDTSLCQNDEYPQDAPVFGDVTSDQLSRDTEGIKILDRVVGSGTPPTIEDMVTINYTGWLEDGCVFDSSYTRGGEARLLLIALIPGWRDAMITMQPGGVRRVEIPPELAYQDLGSPPVIPPNATLIFEFELVSVLTPAAASATATVIASLATATPVPIATPEGGAQLTNCNNAGEPGTPPVFDDVTSDQMTEEPSGIKIFDTTVGAGESPSESDFVCVHYTGWISDGTEFDSSYSRGEATGFPVNGVIPGFRDAILGMSAGGQRRVEIPADQGYGATGAGGLIPPNATLVFDIVLDSFK